MRISHLPVNYKIENQYLFTKESKQTASLKGCDDCGRDATRLATDLSCHVSAIWNRLSKLHNSEIPPQLNNMIPCTFPRSLVWRFASNLKTQGGGGKGFGSESETVKESRVANRNGRWTKTRTGSQIK